MKKLVYQVQNYLTELSTDSVIDIFSVASEDCDYKVIAEFGLKEEAFQFIKSDDKNRHSVKTLEYNGFKSFRVDVCIVQEVIIEIDEESGEREEVEWLDYDCTDEYEYKFNAELAEAAVKLGLHKTSYEWLDFVSKQAIEKMNRRSVWFENRKYKRHSFSKVEDETLCNAIWFSKGYDILEAKDSERNTIFDTLMEKAGIEPSGDLEVDVDNAFMALDYKKR